MHRSARPDGRRCLPVRCAPSGPLFPAQCLASIGRTGERLRDARGAVVERRLGAAVQGEDAAAAGTAQAHWQPRASPPAPRPLLSMQLPMPGHAWSFPSSSASLSSSPSPSLALSSRWLSMARIGIGAAAQRRPSAWCLMAGGVALGAGDANVPGRSGLAPTPAHAIAALLVGRGRRARAARPARPAARTPAPPTATLGWRCGSRWTAERSAGPRTMASAAAATTAAAGSTGTATPVVADAGVGARLGDHAAVLLRPSASADAAVVSSLELSVPSTAHSSPTPNASGAASTPLLAAPSISPPPLRVGIFGTGRGSAFLVRCLLGRPASAWDGRTDGCCRPAVVCVRAARRRSSPSSASR